MDPLTIGLGLAKWLGPKVVRAMTGDKGAQVTEQVLDMATELTGVSDRREAVAVIEQDPTLQLEFQRLSQQRETGWLTLAYADRQDARAMYREKHALADWVVKAIFKWAPALLIVLVGCNIGVLFLDLDTAIVLAVGNLLGLVIGQVLQAVRTIIEFLFGGALTAPADPDQPARE